MNPGRFELSRSELYLGAFSRTLKHTGAQPSEMIVQKQPLIKVWIIEARNLDLFLDCASQRIMLLDVDE